MDKDMRDKIGKWLPEIWKESDGVVTQRDAACIIGISDQSVKLAGDKGAIRYYECENIRRYSFSDCLLYKTTRENVLKRKEILEKLKTDPESLGVNFQDKEDKDQYIEYLMDQYDEAQREEQEKIEEMQEMQNREYQESTDFEEEEVRKREQLEERIKILEEILMKNEK